ncbi:MAG: lipopolysaccharide transport periplasmic protein LptA [Proteobacteria bacterium]|nr:lipopolysaccharide transport periplasmic protein LptA [Pseudomonadota bacterium]
MHISLKPTVFVLLLLFPWAAARALESDRDQPIRIQADSAIVDESGGSSIYSGNVSIVQGSLVLNADEVEIFTAEGEVIQIIARASEPAEPNRLARYEQLRQSESDRVSAEARKITYLVQEERLHLAGNARLQQVQDVFTGELLYYDMSNGIVNLSAGDTGERVQMTINPKKSMPQDN